MTAGEGLAASRARHRRRPNYRAQAMVGLQVPSEFRGQTQEPGGRPRSRTVEEPEGECRSGLACIGCGLFAALVAGAVGFYFGMPRG